MLKHSIPEEQHGEGHSECIHRLLRARADPSAANAQGLTAFDFTRAQKLTESLLSQSMSQSAFLEAMKDNRSELRKSLGGDSLGSDGAAFDNFQFLSSTGFWWKWGTPGGSSHDLVQWLEMQPP
eukprot:symbB.v1.2.024388.t1/scaffold2305.1/size121121/11